MGFALELVDAKRISFDAAEYLQMQTDVNTQAEEQIEVAHLREGGQSCFQALKDGADSKTKSYCCLVWVSKDITPADLRKLSDVTDLKVGQMTPVRVLHRR